jgi:excisionase family DNA binding protein
VKGREKYIMTAFRDEKLLTVDQVAERLQLRPNTIRIYLRDGRLPALKAGRVWRVRESDLLEFIARDRI